jgi:hypothetical protein
MRPGAGKDHVDLYQLQPDERHLEDLGRDGRLLTPARPIVV